MATSMIRPFSLLVKPASADCNLRCHYCFYLDRCQLYPESSRHRMSRNVLRRMLESFFACPMPQYSVGWQGGEPTVMGLDFFRQAVALQQELAPPGAVVSNGLQTNATLIDDEWAAFLAKNRFLCGVSLDGPADIHDLFRKNAAGCGSHADVIRGIDSLRNHQAEFNLLTLVSKANVAQAVDIYRYLCDQGTMHQQYIPCVEFDADGQLEPFAINGTEWGKFLCELFDAWYEHDTRKVSIRYFDAIVAKLVDGVDTVCHLGRDCRQYFVVEHNGDVYPCDFFVEKQWHLGNIMETDWSALQGSSRYRQFGEQKRHWHDHCQACEYLPICAGDCLKHRVRDGVHRKGVMSVLCEGYRNFFAHTIERFEKLAESIRLERRMLEPRPAPPVDTRKVGRNDACPCGSGRKFKKCCGRN